MNRISKVQVIYFQKLPFVYHIFIQRIRAEILHISTAVKRTLSIFFRNDEPKGLSEYCQPLCMNFFKWLILRNLSIFLLVPPAMDFMKKLPFTNWQK